MSSRFSRGSKAYTKTGRAYTVDEVEDGIIYCSLPNGAETEFDEASLLTEKEWDGRVDVQRGVSYSLIRQAQPYTALPVKLDRAATERLLTQMDRLSPGLLDFVAFTTAQRVVTENKTNHRAAELSIVKCREIFEDVIPEIRATLLADFLGQRPEALLEAVHLGDNMARAMLDKGLAPHNDTFEEFLDRPRR